MTNEEAIKIIKSECYIFNQLNFDRSTMVNTALDMAVKALEQEPCEDCVSREAVHNLIIPWLNDYLLDETREALETIDYKIEDLPSVTPRLKTGYWIEEEDFFGDIGYKCSICNEVFSTIEYEPNDSTMNHCPNCGAKMEVEV